MAQNNAAAKKQQLEIIKQNKLNPALYVVLQELDHQLILKHRITGTIKVIEK